jgi:hypothetical protein
MPADPLWHTLDAVGPNKQNAGFAGVSGLPVHFAS